MHDTDGCAIVSEEEVNVLERINLQSLASHISECELMLNSVERGDDALKDQFGVAEAIEKWQTAMRGGQVKFGEAIVKLFAEEPPQKDDVPMSPKLIAPTPVKRTFESIRPFHVLCQWGLLPAVEEMHLASVEFSHPTQCLRFHEMETNFAERSLPDGFHVS